DRPFSVRLLGTSAVGGPAVDSGVPAVEFSISPQADPVEAGGTTSITALVTNRSDRMATDIRTALNAPAGWQVRAVDSPNVSRLLPGQSATVRFTVTLAPDTPMGSHEVHGSATYQQGQVFSLAHSGTIQSL